MEAWKAERAQDARIAGHLPNVTGLLLAWRGGDEEALSRLIPVIRERTHPQHDARPFASGATKAMRRPSGESARVSFARRPTSALAGGTNVLR